MSKFLSRAKDKLRDVASDLPADLNRLKVQIQTTYNPNHRHDEDHEKEEDRQRAAICASHRFNSFAPVRDGCMAKFYLDGLDYFWALSEMIEGAKESIWILDWWLSPELYLRRPPAKHEAYRLDRLLKRKAEQGVKILVIVYKEVTQSMSMSSAHTKHSLEDLHENISCMRHPDHLGGETTLFWSHHEKLVVVDQCVACVGGLDICFGRYDTHTAPLADAKPDNPLATMFPGQDFNNARVQDFQQVDRWLYNQGDRLRSARMPWTDRHSMVTGPIVLDLSEHFIERWNFVRGLKYRHDSRYHLLAFPHVGEEEESSHITSHPHFHKFKQGVKYALHQHPPPEGNDPHGGMGAKGHMRIQAIRSSADWSHGILTEHSIQNAYCQLIREATDFIYIENQFFITATGKGNNGQVQNLIGEAIVERVLSAAKSKKKFSVIIVIPAVPGFAGDIKSSAGTLAIMEATYKSISRGKNSIFGRITAAGFNPNDYIGCYNLRSFDRLADPGLIQKVEKDSGVSWEAVQGALARCYMGDEADAKENKNNPSVKIMLPTAGESIKKEETKNEPVYKQANVPDKVAEALETIQAWQNAYPTGTPSGEGLAHCAMLGGDLHREAWPGSEMDEKQAYITEEKYIHSKLLIIDDRTVLIGSANLNERSQLGERDSEIAIVIEDTEFVETTMNGRKHMATKFAHNFRKQICKMHLGLMPPQTVQFDKDLVTDAMHQVNRSANVVDDRFEEVVGDPLSERFENAWRKVARENAQHFDNVFHCVPSPQVTTWAEYKQWVPKPPQLVGHIFDANMDLAYIKQELSAIQGTLVEMPLNFLEREDLIKLSVDVNAATMRIYI